MSVILRPTTMKVRNDGETEFQGFNVVADEKVAEKVAALEAKGQAILASLPETYTEIVEEISSINSGEFDLLFNSTYYDGYYDATPAYTGTGVIGKKTGWCVVLVPVKKDAVISIENMGNYGGTNSAWLNSNDLSDIYSTFSSASNDGTKKCLTNWLALSVKNSQNEYSDYKLIYSVDENISSLKDVVGTYDNSNNFELGNISISASGWTYSDSSTRVRTKNGETIHIPEGTKIGLTDYKSARYYLGWKTANDEYGLRGWLREDFVTTAEGDYVVLITAVPEVTISDTSELVSLFFNESVDAYGKITNLESKVDILDKTLDLNDNIRSINHRGYNSIAPENTLPAYILSKKKGFRWVETDVRWTSDGVPVLLHDETINRVARNSDGSSISGDIYIKNITYEQALTYDFGIRKGAEYQGVKIPTYEEFLTLCRNIGLKPYVEIKSSDVTSQLLNTLIEVSKKSGIARDITYISDSATVLEDLGEAVANSGLGLVTGSINANTVSSVSGLKNLTDYAFADSSNYTDSEVELCVNGEIGLEVWTINQVDTILNLPTYVSGITSDSLIAGHELYKDSIG